MSNIIETWNITKEYNNHTMALNDVTLNINQGDWVSVIGPSGSGKTTFLNIIGCLDAPTKGTLKINGTDVANLSQSERTTFRRENIGLIFQTFYLIPYLTALENVMIAQYFYGAEDKDRAIQILKKVGMDHRLDHYPSQLSGGEQQRVCIARALVNDPKLLLADEPTGNLDQQNGRNVLDLINKLHEEGHSIVMVTHNMELTKYCNRVISIVDGKIETDHRNSTNGNKSTKHSKKRIKGKEE